MVTKNSRINPFSRKPQVWLGALLAAVVPIGAVTWKSFRSAPGAAEQTESIVRNATSPLDKQNPVPPRTQIQSQTQSQAQSQALSMGGIQSWFEGAANPFLTTAQAKDRKLKDALAKVEAALKGRGDVEEVRILVDENAEKILKNTKKPGAVVSI